MPLAKYPAEYALRAMRELQQRVFAETWRELLASQNSACEAHETSARTAIIKSIRELTAAGVREPGRLKRHALHAARQAALGAA